MMYPFTFVFRIPSLAFIMLTIANAFIGWVTVMTTMMLEVLARDDEVI